MPKSKDTTYNLNSNQNENKYSSSKESAIGAICNVDTPRGQCPRLWGRIYYNITSDADKTLAVTYKGSSYSNYSDEYSGSITIPATVTYNGVAYSVTSIGGSAFRDCRSLTTITLPEGVTSIGDYAFYSCSILNAITIPESVTSIGWDAFQLCNSLTAITLPQGVTSIG